MKYLFQWVSFTFILALGLLFYVHCCGASEMPRKPILQALTEYVTDYLEIYPKRREKAVALLPYLIDICKHHKVPPLLMAKTFSDESSWIETAYGIDRGSYGLGQLHGLAAKGQDLTTARGQIRGSAMWLGQCLDKCKNTLAAIGGYMSKFTCSKNIKRAERRYKGYLKLKKKYCPDGCY